MHQKPLSGCLIALTATTATLLPTPSTLAQPVTDVIQAVAAGDSAMVDALDHAAAGAEVVVVVPSLSQLSEAVARFGAETGLDQLSPELKDMLGMLKDEAQVTEGVDDDGSLIVVVNGLAEAIESGLDDEPDSTEPSMNILVPVSDYNAFVTDLGGEPAAGVTPFACENGSEGFVKQLDGYAVLGETEDEIVQYAAGMQGQAALEGLSQLVVNYVDGGDALVYVDVAAMGPALDAAIDKALEEFQREMNRPYNNQPAMMQGMVESIMQLYAETGRAMVEGTDKLLLTADFGETGLGLTASAQMIEGSKLASYFKDNADAPNAAANLLAAMPEKPYIFAGSIDAQTFAIEQLIDQVNQTFGQENDQTGIVSAYLESIGLMKQANSVASVFYAPDMTAMMGGGFMTTLTAYDVDDTDAFLAQNKAAYEKFNEMKLTLPAAGPDQAPQELSFNTTYTDQAIVIDGVNVDQYQINMVLPPEMMQQFGPMSIMMGNAGTGGYIAGKDGKVLVTTVLDQQLITDGLAALGKDDGFGSAGQIAELRETALPPQASMECYISVDGIANTANPFLMFLSPNGQQIAVPENLPPLAMGLAEADNGVAMRMFLPHELVKFGIDTANDFVPQQQPANNGPRNGPPRAPTSAN